MSHLKLLALIPARGGSKSIPRKNLIIMHGRPLVAWSIHHAKTSNYVNRVIVSTDDQEIARVSRAWGAEVPFLRPAEFADDASPDIDVFRHALQWLQVNENYVPDLIVHLRPTGPARRVKVIDAAIEKMLAHPEADSLRSSSLATQSPFKMWFLQEDDTMRPVITHDAIKESHSVARQTLPKAYWQNGYVDITKPSTILEKNSMVGDCVLNFVMNENVPDVDYFDDLPKVESALKEILAGWDNPRDLLKDSDRHPV
jgi:CMP-N,N'-diacetyllegionaminic acid synthase